MWRDTVLALRSLMYLQNTLFNPWYSINSSLSDETTSQIENVPTTVDLIHEAGYPAEEHTVVTADDYVLTIHR